MALFARPASSDPARFVATIAAAVRGGAWPGIAGRERIAIDGRVGEGPRPGDFAALVSVWAPPGAALPPFDWQGELPPVAVVELDVVETPPSALFGSA
jgi:hypothetical protein